MSEEVRDYTINTRGHKWATCGDYFDDGEEDNEVYMFGYTSGEYCNGPKCVKCGYGFCHHCQEKPSIDCTA